MRVKYIGKTRCTNPYFGRLLPGEVREIPDEIGIEMIRGEFEIVEGKYSLPVKVTIKKKKDCIKCPKKDGE